MPYCSKERATSVTSSRCFCLPDFNPPKYNSARVMSEILQLCIPILLKMFDNLRVLFQVCYACIGVEKMCTVCQHTYQVSICRTISGPCLKSFAISDGVPFPPQSPLNFASIASSRASSFSFQVSDSFLVKNTSNLAFLCFSSCAICSERLSTNQWRSERLIPLSMANNPSIGIVPVSVFIILSFFDIRHKSTHSP